MLDQLFSDLKLAESNVERAQQKQEHYTNLHRQHVEYKVGDKVLLSTSDLRLRMKVTPKLSSRFIGPFAIKRVLSPLVYELDLPPSMQIHPVFHVSKLKAFKESERFSESRTSPLNRPPPEIIDDEAEYEVEAIRDCRERKYGRRMYKQYLVKWKGYPEWENTWEWEDTLTGAQAAVDAYNSSL